MTRIPLFGAVGVVNTALDFVVYACLVSATSIHFALANLIAFLIAATNSYFLNAHITFRSTATERHWHRLASFFVVSSLSVLISTLALFLLAPVLGAIPAKVAAMFVVVPLGYFGSHRFVFK